MPCSFWPVAAYLFGGLTGSDRFQIRIKTLELIEGIRIFFQQEKVGHVHPGSGGDTLDVWRVIQIKLRRASCDVITAIDAQDGWGKALAEDPDVVLMEAMMPRMDGLTTVQKIKAEMNPAPISLMFTAVGQEEDVMVGLLSSAGDPIIKSFASRDVISRVSVALIQAGKKITFDDWGLGIEGSE